MDVTTEVTHEQSAIVVAKMLEHFLCKCKQLQRLPDETYMHAQSANCAVQCIDETQEDDIDTFLDANEALKNAHNAVSDLELEAMRLRCLLKAVHAHIDEQRQESQSRQCRHFLFLKCNALTH